MRYFDLVLAPDSGGLHPVDRALGEVPELTRKALLHIDAFGDGTGVFLYQLTGEPDAAQTFVEEEPSVLDYDLIDVEQETFHLYVHVTPGEPAGMLMALSYEYALIIDTPITFTERGGFFLTIIGRHDMLREALRAAPDSINVSIEQVGEYRPEKRDILSFLTDRQREVFETAVELGYYNIPRAVNQRELADKLGCAPSTVDEHLRKAESKMISSVVRVPTDG